MSPKKVTDEAWVRTQKPRLCAEFLVTFQEPFSASKIYQNEEAILETWPADRGPRSYECTCVLLHNSLFLCRDLEPVQAYDTHATKLVEHTMACIPMYRPIQGICFCEARLVLDTQTHLSTVDLLGTVFQPNDAADKQPRSRYISFTFQVETQ
jgi:hypothetical protein